MPRRLLLICVAAGAWALYAASISKLEVSANRRYLVRDDGKPFFYLADTAWELFHRLNRAEALRYLETRAVQRFTVIQAVAIAELDGLTEPNAHGDLPFIDRDPTRPAVTPGSNPLNTQQYDYWDHVEYIIDEANRRGIYIALLPAWGRWVNDEHIFTLENAQTYGEFLGKRFGRKGIIWILGGDRPADGVEEIWRSMARGIATGATGEEDYSRVVMSFHPKGGQTSSTWFQKDDWLSFNMHQTGHGLAEPTECWARIARDYARRPVKPVMDGEPLYEDHPLAFRASENGYSTDAHVRQRAWWDVFSGAFGHTYGNHAIWQMYTPERKPVNGPLYYWYEAMDRPGARQMQYLRAVMESRPFLTRVPDQGIVENELTGADHIAATRGDGYLLVYTPQGRPFTVNMGRISGEKVTASWYNPRNGAFTPAGEFANTGKREFVPPAEGFGADWILIVDDSSRRFPPPGGLL